MVASGVTFLTFKIFHMQKKGGKKHIRCPLTCERKNTESGNFNVQEEMGMSRTKDVIHLGFDESVEIKWSPDPQAAL